ncbi:MAG: DUF2085 domain-containing protein [Methanomassiliicoccales archaeon]|nr:DUF2085 domain-containing protein [Methanomassiliicoccales archaeon]
MRLSPPLRYMALFETLLALAFLFIVISPLTLPTGSVSDLDGRIGSVDNWDELQEMPLLQRLVYLIGDLNCHQQADRSFFLNDNQLPICARDVGIVAGLTLGLIAYMLVRWPVRWTWLLLLLVPMALDGGAQALTSYESGNVIRALTGCLAGAGLGWGIGMLTDRFFTGDRQNGRSSK